MSSTYRMNWIWVSHGGQLRTDLRETAGGLAQVRRESTSSQRQMSAWGQQMRAFGTTIRYALAGAVLYGVASAISSLSDFEAKMGEIAATATKVASSGGIQAVGQSIQQLGDYVLDASTRLISPVEQVQATMQTFYSSFDVPPGSRGMRQVKEFVDYVTKGARVAEVQNPQQYANGVITLANSLMRGRRDVPKATDLISFIVQQSVGFRGEQLGMNLTRLAQAAAQGRFTAQQMAGLVVTASLSGGNPNLTARGLSALMQTILHPTTKEQQTAYRGIGLPTDPNQLGRMGGQAVLNRIMASVGDIRVSRAGRFIPDETLATLGENPTAQQLGLVQGRGGNLRLLFQLVHQSYAARALVQILSKGSATVDEYTKRADKATGATNRMFAAFSQEAQLQQAQVAWRNFSLQLVRNLDPVTHAVARVVTKMSELSQAHHRISTGITAGIGGLAGARILARMGVGRAFTGRFFAREGRLGGAAATATAMTDIPAISAMMAEAGPSLLSGIGTGSRAAPLWVIIHPLSWGMPGAPDFQGGGGGGPGVPGLWLGRAKSMLAVAGIATAAGLTALFEGKTHAAERVLGFTGIPGLSRQKYRHPFWHLFGSLGGGDHPQLTRLAFGARTPQQEVILNALHHHYISKDVAERRLERLNRQLDSQGSLSQRRADAQVNVQGNVQSTFTLRGSPELEKFLRGFGVKKVHQIPVTTVKNRPQYRGRDKTLTHGGNRG